MAGNREKSQTVRENGRSEGRAEGTPVKRGPSQEASVCPPHPSPARATRSIVRHTTRAAARVKPLPLKPTPISATKCEFPCEIICGGAAIGRRRRYSFTAPVKLET
jgi:hypothetical protein